MSAAFLTWTWEGVLTRIELQLFSPQKPTSCYFLTDSRELQGVHVQTNNGVLCLAVRRGEWH